MAETIVVALGGNSMVRPGQRGTLEEQRANLAGALSAVVALVRRGARVVVTHGNGPQVGQILARVEAARPAAYDLPLDVCVAQSQGETGFVVQQEIENLLEGGRGVAALVTRVLVSVEDPGFAAPTKPVGRFLDGQEALERIAAGQTIVEDAHRGYRRVVPSPVPLRVLEAPAVRALLEAGFVVVAAGGGGIPVIEDAPGRRRGIPAVVDKDLATSMLASESGADRILSITGVDAVKLDFGTPSERSIPRMTPDEARRHLDEGQFAPGSMWPKVESAIRFVRGGGREVIITDPEHALEALEGRAGTRISR